MKAANTEDVMLRSVSRSRPELGWRVAMAWCPGDRPVLPRTHHQPLADSGQFLSFPAQLSPSTTYSIATAHGAQKLRDTSHSTHEVTIDN